MNMQIHNIDAQAWKDFVENVNNRVLMQRAQAIVRQRRMARVAREVGGQVPHRGRHGELLMQPKANINTHYYMARMNEEREANPERMASGENIWKDPEFVDWELKRNEALRPVLNEQNKPMHMNGLVMPTKANFEAARKGSRC